jgi:hypothetical protein
MVQNRLEQREEERFFPWFYFFGVVAGLWACWQMIGVINKVKTK